MFNACDGKVCGTDGCGGSCGECLPDTFCIDGQCPPDGSSCFDGNLVSCDGCTEGEVSESLVGTGVKPAVASGLSGGIGLAWRKANVSSVVRFVVLSPGGEATAPVDASQEDSSIVYEHAITALGTSAYLIARGHRKQKVNTSTDTILFTTVDTSGKVLSQGGLGVVGTTGIFSSTHDFVITRDLVPGFAILWSHNDEGGGHSTPQKCGHSVMTCKSPLCSVSLTARPKR